MLSQQRILFFSVIGALVIYLGLYHDRISTSIHAVDVHEIEIFQDVGKNTHHSTGEKPASYSSPQDPSKVSETPAHDTYNDLSAASPKPDSHPLSHNNVELKANSTLNSSVSTPDTAFNGLLDLCKQTDWTDGLWLHCNSNCGNDGDGTSICGGLNNARNRIQTCIRLAIDTGSGIIIPSVTTRDENDLVNTDDNTVCADFFWDMEYLQKALAEQCPQLQIRLCGSRTGITTIIEPEFRTYLSAPHYNTTFRALVTAELETNNVTFADVTSYTPAVISYGDTYIGFNYQAADELSTIRKALFKVLRFNEELLELSSQVLKSKELHEGAFIGVHLRGENDWPGGFGAIEDQMRTYTAEIRDIKDIKTVYVSCGDSTAIQRFRDILVPYGYIVHDKWTLLTDLKETLNKVESLSFDQKGIVEYQVLVEARFFLGVIMSSMSSLIAFARTVDEPEDLFETYIFPNSSKSGLNRGYEQPLTLKGSWNTKLMVVNGVDIMEAFP
jgi:hypothetical protein